MARDTAALLDRVKKLLALAGSPNVHEAALAAARAQALIEAHRLEGMRAEEESDPVTDGREAPLEQGRRLRRWKVYLASALGEVNGCVAWTEAVGAEERLLLVGRAADRAAVQEIWAWLVKQIEWLSATAGPGRSRRWHEAFRIGAAEAVADRLAEVGTESRAGLGEAALAVVEPALAARQAAVTEFVETHLRLRSGRGLRVDTRAYARGREAGAEMPMVRVTRSP